jgi:hypothetical protein
MPPPESSLLQVDPEQDFCDKQDNKMGAGLIELLEGWKQPLWPGDCSGRRLPNYSPGGNRPEG